jgi:DNA primase
MPRFGATKQKSSERQALLDAHSAACAFYEKLLAHPEHGQAARKYLEERGINAESIKRFQIGVAPDAWDALVNGSVGKKFPAGQLALAGLVKSRERGGGFYDTFRNRLMFPIRDEGGRIIAFGGRVMPGSQDPAKYLNSPETPLFSKSRSIFGIDLARQKIVETRTVAVVEGYTDVVMAHQYGVSNVVSILGTAMTEQHVSILRRFADRIVLLFDADTAGDKAVDRAVELFLTQPIEITIASMPEGVDPDEYLLEHGAESFQQVLSQAADALTYKWKQLSRQFNASNDLTGQQKAVEEYLQTLAQARGAGPVDSLRWGAALTRVSRLTEIPVEELNRRFKAGNRQGKRVGTQVQAAREPTNNVPSPLRRPLGGQDRAERWILGILLAEPNRWHEVQHQLQPSEFSDESRRALAEIYWNHQRDEGEPVFNEFLALLSDAEKQLAVEVLEEAEGLSDMDQTLDDALLHLRNMKSQREEQKLVAELRRTNEQPLDAQDEVALLLQLQEKARTPNLRRV